MERYRFHEESAAYFVTFAVVDWLPIFVSEAACRIVAESLNFCHHNKGLRTNAYILMPTHFHGILFDAEFSAESLSRCVADLRKFTGRRLLDHCAQHMPRCFSETFGLAAGNDRERRFWQPSRHPEAIRSARFWRQKLDYLHDNPRRKGLVTTPDAWRFSSAAFWLSGGEEQSDAILSAIQW